MPASTRRGGTPRSWNPFRPYGPLQGWCPVFVGGLVALLLLLVGCGAGNATAERTTPSTLVDRPATSAPNGTPTGPDGTTAEDPGLTGITHPDIGFRSRRSLDDHFRKHGGEFGGIDRATYLALAQDLRDRPIDRVTIEIRRRDGVITRFDRGRGAFGAYNGDRTIRTYFRPNDGEAYFRRQAKR